MVRRCLGYFKEGVHTKCSKRSKWQTSLWLRFNAAWTGELHGNDCCRRGMEVAWIGRACAAQSKLINNMRLGHDKHQQASASISKQSASKISKWVSPSCLPPSSCGGEDMAQAPLSTLLGSQVNEITALLTRLTDAEVRREYHRSSGWEIVGDDGRW